MSRIHMPSNVSFVRNPAGGCAPAAGRHAGDQERGNSNVGFRPELRDGCARRRCGPSRCDRCRSARPHDPRLQLHGHGRRSHRRGGLAHLPGRGGNQCGRQHRRTDAIRPSHFWRPGGGRPDAGDVRAGDVHQPPHPAPATFNRPDPVPGVRGAAGLDAIVPIPGLYGRLRDAGVLSSSRRPPSAH